MQIPKEVIKIGQIEIRFLLDGEDTRQQQSVFEFIVPAGARVPAPHYHVGFDETVYGLEGTLTFTVDSIEHEIGPGDCCFVPRGAVHGFMNRGTETTRTLAVITPGVLGPAYFRELAELVGAGGPPDTAKVAEIMRNHGLVIAP